MMPIRSTAPISALRSGLAKKAAMIWLSRTIVINAHSTRNTNIRTRKIRGQESFVNSISIGVREEGPGAIAGVFRCEKPLFGWQQYGTARPRKRLLKINGSKGAELPREGWPGPCAYFRKALKPQAVNGDF